MAALAVTTETGGNTLARYLDEAGNFQGTDPADPTAPPPPPAPLPATQGITDPTVRSGDPSAGGLISRGDPAGGGTGTQGGSTAPPPASYNSGDPASVIDALYKQYGIGDGGRGSGFADRAYWLEHPSEILNGRLAADLAGTGSDQPTGTPGSGPWQNSGRGGASTPAAGNPAAAPTGPAVTGTTGGAVVAQPSEFTNYLRSLIQSRLAADSTPVDPNAQNIAAPLTAARDEATRASDAERTAAAERLYGQGGLNTNALNQTIQQSSERNAGALSTLRGNLIMNAYNQKNDELKSLLQMALASGDAESARAVQAQIANLQAEINREGLGVTLAINSTAQNAGTINAGLGA